MARRKLLGFEESYGFKLYVLELLRPTSRKGFTWLNRSQDLKEQLEEHIEVKACPLLSPAAVQELLETQSEHNGSYICDPYRLEALVTPHLKEGKSFDDLYKAFRNKERQAKSREKKATKRVTVSHKAERVFDDQAAWHSGSKLDMFDDLTEFLKVVCNSGYTIHDLKWDAHKIAELVGNKK